MARIRSKRPEFYVSGSMARCCVHARYLFEGMWTFMDDSGVHPADALQAKMEIFPSDDFSESQINAWIAELVAQESLVEFTVPPTDDPALHQFVGRKFWISVNWHHQKIDHPTRTRAPIRAAWLASLGIEDAGREVYFAPAASPAPSQVSAALDGDAAAIWRQATLRARETFLNLGLAARKQDRNLALKICYLVIAGRLREEWLTEAVKGARKAAANPPAGKPFRPGAYLTGCFKNKCREARPPLDFRRLLAECPEPPDAEPPAAGPQSPPPAPATPVDTAALLNAAAKPPPAAERKKTRAEISRELANAAAGARAAAPKKPRAPPVHPELDPVLQAEAERKKAKAATDGHG